MRLEVSIPLTPIPPTREFRETFTWAVILGDSSGVVALCVNMKDAQEIAESLAVGYRQRGLYAPKAVQITALSKV